MTKNSKNLINGIVLIVLLTILLISPRIVILTKLKLIENGPYLWDDSSQPEYIYHSIKELKAESGNKKVLMKQMLKSENGSIAAEGMVLAYWIIDDHQELEELLKPFKNDKRWNYWVVYNDAIQKATLAAHKIKHNLPLTNQDKEDIMYLETFGLIDIDKPFEEWPTYINEEYDFKLPYPPYWSSANIYLEDQERKYWQGWPEEIHSPFSIFAQSFANTSPDDMFGMLDTGRWMSVEIFDNPNQLSIKQFIKHKTLYPNYRIDFFSQEPWQSKAGLEGYFRREYAGMMASGDRVDYFVFYVPLKDSSKVLSLSIASFKTEFEEENIKLLKKIVEEGLNFL